MSRIRARGILLPVAILAASAGPTIFLSACSRTTGPRPRPTVPQAGMATARSEPKGNGVAGTRHQDPTPRKPATRRRLTVEDLFSPKPLWGRPAGKAVWSWDGKRLYFARPSAADADILDLWVLENGKPRLLVSASRLLKKAVALTEAQRASLERRRVRSKGITDFRPGRAGKGIILPVAGRTFYYDIQKDRLTDLFPKPAGELDPRLSPDGKLLAFVRKGDLWIRDMKTGRQRRLTRRNKPTITNAVAEFVAQEELGRYRGYWWAPDSKSLAYTEVDEAPVQVALRPKYSKTGVSVIRQRYPAAGTPNAKVRLGILSIRGGRTRWLDLGQDRDIYLARVKWTHRGLVYQILSRDQRRLDVRLWSPKTRKARLLFRETSPTYVRLHKDFRDLGKLGFLWSKEQESNRRLWLYDWQGKPVRALTPKDVIVDKVEAADAKQVLFSVSLDRGRKRHLHRVSLEDGKIVCLTKRLSWHQVAVNRTGTAFVDRASDLLTPPRVSVQEITKDASHPTKRIMSLDLDEPKGLRALGLQPPRSVTISAADGTPLNGLLFFPPDFDPHRRYPAVIYTYGGPGGAVALHRWRSSVLWHQFLADKGFVVLVFDGRGTGHRGKAFELSLFHKFGLTDVADVEAAVRFLSKKPFVRPGHVGLWGWSYGGFVSVMTAVEKPSLLAAALAVAPVTDWRLYDTAYTERHLGRPKPQAALYHQANPLHLADKLTVPLMLIHGMADDNVLLRHSLTLIERLVEKGRRFEMLYFPGKRHSLKGRTTRKMLLRTIADFFQRHMGTPTTAGRHR